MGSSEKSKIVDTQRVGHPAPVAVTSESWSSPHWSSSTIVGNYNRAADHSSASVTLFVPNTTSQPGTFYWISGSNGQPWQVTYSYCMANNQCNSASVSFNVTAPTLVNITSKIVDQVAVHLYAGSEWVLQFGTASNPDAAGITFTGSETDPSTQGTTYWVQTLSVSIVGTRSDNTQNPFSDSGLDNTDPYVNSFTTPTFTTDAPEIVLQNPPYIEQTINDSFNMYWMWQPNGIANSIPVPLGHASWNWGGDAVYGNNAWALNSGSGVSNRQDHVGDTTFPTWTHVVQNTN